MTMCSISDVGDEARSSGRRVDADGRLTHERTIPN